MISVSLASLEDLNENELSLIVKYCAKCFEPLAYEDLVSRVRSGDACIYRFSGDAAGLFILATGDGGLYVETVAGESVVKYFDEIYAKIRSTASACGARRLYSFVSRDSLRRLYDRKTNAAPVATLYREELK